MPLPALLAAAMPAVIPAGINVLGGMLGAGLQKDANIHAAKRQFRWQRSLIEEQNIYNSPKAQMARFAEAGLNPHLIYGQGSAGNWESSAQAPNIRPADYQSALSGIGTQMAQAQLMHNQAQLTKTKVDESTVKQELMKSQKAVVESNPFLDVTYFNAFVQNLIATAALKKQEADYMTRPADYKGINTQGEAKMFFEIEQLRSKYNLNDADSKVRAEIIKSKQFQNDIDELMRNWVVDGKVNYGQIEKMIPIIMMLFKGK